jgi:hypothetical protein
MKKKILGINDDRDFCQCCGKTGLRRVVWIENIETGTVRHFGTYCAGKNAPALFGEIKAAKKADDNRDAQAWSTAHRQYRREGGTYTSTSTTSTPNDAKRLREIHALILRELRAGKAAWKLELPMQPDLFADLATA